MAENKTSKVNNGENGQKSTVEEGNRLAFVHEFIEILVGIAALVSPAVFLFLWVYRFATCLFYGLPTFHSSLNIVRILPAVFIVVGIVIYIWLMFYVDLSGLFSLTITKTSREHIKKQTYSIEKVRDLNTVFNSIRIVIRAILFILLPFVPLKEMATMINGEYPFYFKSRDLFEAIVVLIYVVVGNIAFSILLYQTIRDRKKIDLYLKKSNASASRKLRDWIVRVSYKITSILSAKKIISILVGFCLFSLITMTCYVASFRSYSSTSYYLVDFDGIRYAIVLDTDEYYIGEPIEITEINNDRTLIIHTDSYIYLDKAENPLLARKESFNTIKILRD